MRSWMLAVAVALMTGAAAPMYSQEGGAAPEQKPEEKVEKKEEGKEPAKEEEKDVEKEGEERDETFDQMLAAVLKDIGEVTGKVEATEDDVKALIKHHEPMNKVMRGDAKFTELKSKNMKQAFEYLIKHEGYMAYCKQEGLECELATRKMLRVRTGFMREHLPALLDDLIKSQKAMIEEYKEMLPEEDYKEAVKGLADAEEMFKKAKKELETIPAPTDAEKKLFGANKEALTRVMNDSGSEAEEEGEEEGEDDEGMGG